MLSFVLALGCTALATPVALSGATLHPVDGPPIPSGVVLLDAGKILAVGAADAVTLPSDATVVDVAGRHIIPGLIDMHSHIGGGRLHEALGVVQPGVSAADAIDPSHISIARARAGGITTVNVMPGSGKLMGGQTAYLSLRSGSMLDELLLCRDPNTQDWRSASAFDAEDADAPPARHRLVCGGVKMANGTNPQGSGGDPRTRMGSAYLQRKALLEGRSRAERFEAARAYEAAGWWHRVWNAPPPMPDPDLAADILVQVVQGKRIVHFHSHRADDMITALRLREEVDERLQLVLHHGSEGFKVADLVAEAGVPVAINVIDTPGGKEETLERRLENPAILAKAGVSIVIITDDPVQDSRLLLRSAGLAVRGGLSEDAALRSLTLSPAELLGMDHQTGSLTAGKEADLVVLSGPPLSVWSRVEQTWADGERVFLLSEDEPIQQGGDVVGGSVGGR
ncbi:MAG: amidohydrolase [Deltaproteobacteria bacterium]|nr:amidohydrolase [Deltaproteobacteria bacterium]